MPKILINHNHVDTEMPRVCFLTSKYLFKIREVAFGPYFTLNRANEIKTLLPQGEERGDLGNIVFIAKL